MRASADGQKTGQAFLEPGTQRLLASAVSLHLQGRGEEALGLLHQLVETVPECAEARYGCARLCEELGKYEEAVEHYAKYLDRNPESANGLLHVGLCLQRLGRWRDSIEPLRMVVEAEPSNVEALSSLGLSLLREQDPGPALGLFEEALRQEPGNVMVLLGKAAAHHALLEVEEAEKCYRGVLERNPGHETALVNLTLLARQRGSVADVLALANELLRMELSAETAHEALAWAAVEERRFDEAEQHCQACCSLSPERFENWVNLAVCRQQAGRTGDAIEAYQRAAALRPNAPVPYLQLGYLYHTLGDIDRAAEHYQTSLRLAPDSLEATLNLAMIHDQRGDGAAAEELYERAAALDPGNRAARLALGRLRSARYDFAGAVAAFESCLTDGSQDEESVLNLAMCLHRAGRTADSRRVLTNFLEASPGSTDAIRLLATIELEQGQSQEALRWHRALIDKGEAGPEVYHNAGLLSEELNEPEQALEYLRKSVSLDPEFGEALVTLGHVLDGLGQHEEARACWSRAVEANPELATGYFLGTAETGQDRRS